MRGAIWLLGMAILVSGAVFADDDEQGGEIEGTEQLHQEILLTATADAPEGATGKAKLEAENEDGITSAGMEVEVRGLLPGTYTVSVTRKSDGSTVELGKFGVGASGSSMDDDENEMGDDSSVLDIEFGTEAGLPLPDDLNPLDIAGIAISDANRVVILTGNFTDADETTKAFFKAKVAVNGGDAAPNAKGVAIIQTRTRHGLKTSRFKLNVKGITPNATLDLKINGQDFGTITTDKHGKLRLNSLPGGIEADAITFMEFAEPDGTNALTISF